MIKIYLITWVTYCSRVSQRMIEYKVKSGEGIWIFNEDEVLITRYIAEIIKEDRIKCFAYNICGDHIHMAIACKEEKLSEIVQKLKSVSSRKFYIAKGITVPRSSEQGVMTPCSERKRSKGVTQNHLWAQKYNKSHIETYKKLENAIEYVKSNRIKHGLSKNDTLENIIKTIEVPYSDEILGELRSNKKKKHDQTKPIPKKQNLEIPSQRLDKRL